VITQPPIRGRDTFDIAVLARRKADLGLTTSVVIPARDEGTRVGAVVTAIRRAMEPVAGTGVALVDEIVVIDGGSTDATALRAEEAGARVVPQTNVGTGSTDGPRGGKGAALQQGVASTAGDLVAFVDADVHDPDPWLAIGTLAPLIMDLDVRLVKSAAQRSWEGGASDGGGRVTELTVRPLLALLWQDLAHIAQPLAGEYAADRGLLESLPFEQGYGVEIGLLLDTWTSCGAAAIAQVDLGVRHHDHQPLDALSRMAAEIVLVISDRLAREERPLLDADGTTIAASVTSRLALPRPFRDVDGLLQVAAHEVGRTALPPLVSGGPRPRRRGPSHSS
jgi:glucosyl-3-phosphoglycerate synthase